MHLSNRAYNALQNTILLDVYHSANNAQLIRTKSANQPFSFFIQIAHLSARFRCQPCNDKLFSLQTTISILYLVRTHLQTKISILHLVRTSLQTSDPHFISILDLVRTYLQTRIKILHLVRTSLQTSNLHFILILHLVRKICKPGFQFCNWSEQVCKPEIFN